MKPVVSDFDTFTVGSRGLLAPNLLEGLSCLLMPSHLLRPPSYPPSCPFIPSFREACATANCQRIRRARTAMWPARPWPWPSVLLQAKLITWLLQRTQEILGSLDHNPWTSRWLEAQTSAEKKRLQRLQRQVLKKENEKEAAEQTAGFMGFLESSVRDLPGGWGPPGAAQVRLRGSHLVPCRGCRAPHPHACAAWHARLAGTSS